MYFFPADEEEWNEDGAAPADASDMGTEEDPADVQEGEDDDKMDDVDESQIEEVEEDGMFLNILVRFD